MGIAELKELRDKLKKEADDYDKERILKQEIKEFKERKKPSLIKNVFKKVNKFIDENTK